MNRASRGQRLRSERTAIFLGIVLVSVAARALESDVLIVSGYTDLRQFYGVSSNFHQVVAASPASIKSPSKTTVIAGFGQVAEEAGPRQWESAFPNFKEIRTADQLNQGIADYVAATSKSSKPGFVVISDHGTAPLRTRDVEKDPLTGSITAPVGDLQHSRLAETLEANWKSGQPLRLVGLQCFSGGLHHIAFSNPNVCAASMTSWREKAYGADFEDSMDSSKGRGYQQAFAREIADRNYDLDGNGKTSLMEAHVAGMFADRANYGRPQTSSMAYMDLLTRQRGYRPDYCQGGICALDVHKLATDHIHRVEVLNPALVSGDGSRNNCAVDDPIGKQISFFEDFVRSEMEQSQILLTANEQKALPAELRQMYESLMKNERVKEALSRDQGRMKNDNLKEINARLAKQVKQWEESRSDTQEAFANCGNDECRAAYAGQMEKLRLEVYRLQQEKQEILSSSIEGLQTIVRYMKSAAYVMVTGTDEQKTTLQRLLKCEMADL